MTATELLDGRRLKIVIVGNSKSAKTHLLSYITHGDRVTDPSTVIVSSAVCLPLTVQGKRVTLEVWDAPGAEQYRSLVPMYLRDASAVLSVYGTHERDSFDSVQSWVEIARSEPNGNLPVLIVAWDGKKDPSVVSESEGRSLAERLGAFFVEMHSDQSVITKGLEKFLEDVHL
jgi:small GTP-binding protein